MDLYDLIPNNLFTVLTSKNRSIYAKSLLIIYNFFKENIIIDKDVVVAHLINELQSDIFDIDTNVDGETIESFQKDATSLAKYIMRRLLDTGWIDVEYESYNKLQEYVSLPPYSIKLISTISEITNNEVKEYDSFMYAMYSSLLNSDQNYNDFRFTALNNVYDKMHEFEESLKTLFHNLKRRYTNLVSLKTVNQILSEHFDSYQKDVIMQIYLPLKTKDSITRFKGSIFNILVKWMRDEQISNSMIAQAMVQKRFQDDDEAKLDILTKINYIVDKLNDLDELVDLIDSRNSTYISAATEKMHHLLSNDRSIMGKITKIIATIAKDELNGYNNNLHICQDFLFLQKQEYLNEESLFNRAQSIYKYSNNEPSEILYVDEQIVQKLKSAFEESTNNKFSYRNVINYMKEQLEDINHVSTKNIALKNSDDFLLLLHSFIHGFDNNVFYSLKLYEGNVINSNYLLPNLEFIRRRI